ncbi:hypothetical protein [Paracoccus sp. JM45]|uniref:hypothetical protein n=1 Tax=Paracoccus sp. JM45 TaxID=2283626 RepID=UPI0011C4435E|nr:hypothetical protein [Paracoccus sp. JM45]
MINNKIDIYEPPSRSLSARMPPARSRGSSRGLITAHLPEDSGPRHFVFESKLEQKVFYLLSGRSDIVNIHEQSAPISYRSRQGCLKKHFPDFLVTQRCGTRLAIAVKPHRLVERTCFRDELALIRIDMPLSYAKELVLITEQSFAPCEARNAERFHEFRRHTDPEADAKILDLLANLNTDITIASLVASSGLEGRGFRAIFRAVYMGLASTIGKVDIRPSTVIHAEVGK